MANNLKYSAVLKNGRLDQITTKMGASGLLRIYSGAQPANPDAAVGGGTLLVELPCSATFAPVASGGVLTISAITQADAVAGGTAAWFRFCKSDGTGVVDGTVGTSGSDLNLQTIAITLGQPIGISSFTFTAAN